MSLQALWDRSIRTAVRSVNSGADVESYPLRSSAIVTSRAFRPSGAPGRPTLRLPVRKPTWPVMNADRPAVQLCDHTSR